MLVLASASPRRQTLLKQLGFEFSILSADINETPTPNEPPDIYVKRMAQEKGQYIETALLLNNTTEYKILSADTIVTIDRKILGKPQNSDDFLSMMNALSGRWHRVLTAVTLTTDSGIFQLFSDNQVLFDHLTEQDKQRYWHTKEPLDKAGGYAVQGIGSEFVKEIKGSYSAIVGLPLCETKALLLEAGECTRF